MRTSNIEHPTSNVEGQGRTCALSAFLRCSTLDVQCSTFAAGVLLLALAVPVLFGRVYVADDLGEFHLPARAFYARCLAEGYAFDWWPDVYGGLYLTGEGQAGTYHPLHWLLYRCLPLTYAFGLEVWFSYPLMLAGMFVWLRRRLGRSAAMFAALVFTFSGFNLLHFVHVNAIAVVAHIPWLLWLIDVAVCNADQRRRAAAAAGIALLTGSQLLLGYPQYVWFSLIAEAAYFVALWRGERSCNEPLWRGLPTAPPADHSLWRGLSASPQARPQVSLFAALFALATAKLTGLLIGGAQLLPTFEALRHSTRGMASAEFLENGSLHPLNLVQFVAPYMFEHRVVGQNTHELGLYIGAVPIVLVFWLMRNGRTIERGRWLVGFAAITAAVALLMALGSYGPLSGVQSHLPVIGKFRFPVRIVVLVYLALAIVAGVGLSALAKKNRSSTLTATALRRRRAIYVPAALSVLATVAAAIAWPQHLAPWPLVVAGPVLVTAATLLVVRAERKQPWALAALVLFAAADLGVYGFSYAIYPHTSSLTDYAVLRSQPPGPVERRVAMDALPAETELPQSGNRITLAGWRTIGGYAGLPPVRLLDYRDPTALRVAGVGWLGEPIVSDNQLVDRRFRPIADPLPEFRLVSDVQISSQPAAIIRSVDLSTTAVVDRPLVLPAGRQGDVRIQRDEPGRIELRTQTPSRQLLVVAQNNHPGWHATIDGRPTAVWPVYGDFMGCTVPAGRHDVRLTFRPASLKNGIILSFSGLGLMICSYFASLVGASKR